MNKPSFSSKRKEILDAQSLLDESLLFYQDRPVGCRAALSSGLAADNYAECFLRDFVPVALVFLYQGKSDIVREFLRITLQMRNLQEEIEGHRQLPRLMPASFRIEIDHKGDELLVPDFGDRAIGRVAPVDAMMWWVLLLQAYVHISKDRTLSEEPFFQRGLHSILGVLLYDRFEVFPTLLVPDGAFMIDRRMGVYGHPLEIQSLFFGTLNAICDLLIPTPITSPLLELATKRKNQLIEYIRDFYWLDPRRLNEIHRYETEDLGYDARNPLNIHPESIPDWVTDWLPDNCGYLIGNMGPGRMDFRFFSFGNLLAIIFGLSTPQQSESIIRLFDTRWNDLVGQMPIKLVYPAITGSEWRILTGSDPKNVPWSYHNGGNWPTLIWPTIAAFMKLGHKDTAKKLLDFALPRLHHDNWPEYYDGRYGRLLGRRANLKQTWTAAATILGDLFIEEEQTLYFWDHGH